MVKEAIKVGKEEISLEDDIRALVLALQELTAQLKRLASK